MEWIHRRLLAGGGRIGSAMAASLSNLSPAHRSAVSPYKRIADEGGDERLLISTHTTSTSSSTLSPVEPSTNQATPGYQRFDKPLSRRSKKTNCVHSSSSCSYHATARDELSFVINDLYEEDDEIFGISFEDKANSSPPNHAHPSSSQQISSQQQRHPPARRRDEMCWRSAVRPLSPNNLIDGGSIRGWVGAG